MFQNNIIRGVIVALLVVGGVYFSQRIKTAPQELAGVEPPRLSQDPFLSRTPASVRAVTPVEKKHAESASPMDQPLFQPTLIRPGAPKKVMNRPSRSVIAKLKLGKEVIYEEEGWRAVRNAVAVHERDRKLAESIGEVIGSQGSFLVVRYRQNVSLHSHEMKPVVFHQDHQKFGIVTGTLIIRLSDFDLASKMASDYRLGVIHAQESIQTVFYTALDSDPFQKLEELKQDKRIVGAQVEILTNSYERQ